MFGLGASVFLLAAVVIAGLICLGVVAYAARYVFLLLADRRAASSGQPAATRQCRYCHLGRARVREENASIEGDDLVEVRCYVCGSCGLPQWTVQRSPVLKVAS
ncbi:MAG TPA: hypothetical protein VKX16_16165 [Chloroflexota bacterium]|nr:hypothetical protein [Chloroflexota bacterium]